MPRSIAEVDAELTARGSRFEIRTELVRGVETRVWARCPPNLTSILRLSVGHGDQDFIVYEDERTTFAQHAAGAATFGHRLIDDLGVRKGDRVAVAMRNLPEWSVAFWGAAVAGAVVVPLNAWWTGPELQYALADCAARVVIADPERVERLTPHLADLPGLRVVAVRAQGAGPTRLTARWDDLIGGLDPATFDPPDVDVGPDDHATIFYTSGTTGTPKGALGTHRNICSALLNSAFVQARSARRAAAHRDAPEGDHRRTQSALLLSVPLFHSTGCHAMLVASLASGRKLVMMHRWDPERALELIERERIRSFGGVPAMVWQVLDSPDFAGRDTSSVRSVSYGGSPAPPELVRRIRARFPSASPGNGYGLTETSAIATMNTGEDYVGKPDSVGVPVPVCEVKLVDGDGRDLPGGASGPSGSGATGELWIKGPNVIPGYWGDPEATAASFSDGWLHTGDVARIDDEGFVFIVDRAKDLIIRGGENVYCVEVEHAVVEHPAVADAAVIAVPHPTLGEEVGVVVQLRPGQELTVEELRAFLADRLAAFMIPVRVWTTDEDLPRNPAGKVLKGELRRRFQAGAGRD